METFGVSANKKIWVCNFELHTFQFHFCWLQRQLPKLRHGLEQVLFVSEGRCGCTLDGEQTQVRCLRYWHGKDWSYNSSHQLPSKRRGTDKLHFRIFSKYIKFEIKKRVGSMVK
jgi:hypothetical protein